MSSQSRIELYKEAMNIEHERAALQAKLDHLQARLANIQGALFAGASVAAPAKAAAVTAKAAAPKAGGRQRAARGVLKQRILEALAAAGNEGIRVRDLSKAINVGTPALHSWFQFARKSIPAVRKAGKGRYKLVGPVPVAPEPAAAKPKAAKPAAAKGKRTERGALAASIQEALAAAGKDGVKVSELATKLGHPAKNIFVWFATTGKKNKAIKKAGPGHYRLES